MTIGIHSDFLRAAQNLLDDPAPTVDQLADVLQQQYREGHKAGRELFVSRSHFEAMVGRPFQRGDMGHPDNEMGM